MESLLFSKLTAATQWESRVSVMKQALRPLEEICSENTHALAEVILDCLFIWEFAIQNELQCFSTSVQSRSLQKSSASLRSLLDFRPFIEYWGLNIHPEKVQIDFLHYLGVNSVSCQINHLRFSTEATLWAMNSLKDRQERFFSIQASPFPWEMKAALHHSIGA